MSDIAAMVTENENLLNNSNIMFFTVCWILLVKYQIMSVQSLLLELSKGLFFQISADLEKNGGQKCSTG